MGKQKVQVGVKYGSLTVIRKAEPYGDKQTRYLCQCDCGKTALVKGGSLINGKTKSCGCARLKNQSRLKDLTGHRFGKLIVQEYFGGSKWKCLCDCGNTSIVSTSNLQKGNTTSCGCKKVKDILTQRFGKLVVISKAQSRVLQSGEKASRWNVLCDCGNQFETSGDALRNGTARQCPLCWRKEQIKAVSTHQLSNSRLYGVWSGMKNRCYNPKMKHYKDYGGRGITICEEWLDFKNFHDWAYANGYDENAPKGQCTIDRIDNDKGYSPDNCRWITIDEQNKNRRAGVQPPRNPIELNGEKKSLSQWCKYYNISRSCVYDRIKYRSWDILTALTTPT